MSYNILTIPPFDKQIKRLAKKYPSIKEEFAKLLVSLEQKPEQGTSLGNTAIKFEYLWHRRVKESLAEQGLLPIL